MISFVSEKGLIINKMGLRYSKLFLILWILYIKFDPLYCSKKLEEDANSSTLVPNKFVSLQAECTREAFMIHASFEEPFDGALYARGYPLECRSVGSKSPHLSLIMDVSTCGIKVLEKEDGSIEYETSVYIQYDHTVQRAIDEHITVRCTPNEPSITSTPQAKTSTEIRPQPRNLQVNTTESNEKKQPRPEVRSWLDVLRGDSPLAKPVYDHLSVGDDVTLLIKVQERQSGLHTKVVNCVGHDGSGENLQPLIDNKGCPIDDSIMPEFQQTLNPKTHLKLFYSTFKVFKFPDRDNLHLRCHVLVCREKCPQKSCRKLNSASQENNSEDSWMQDDWFDDDKIWESIEVFNAIEVRAPGIETETMRLDGSETGEVTVTHKKKGLEITCTNASRLIVAFGLLIGIFVISIVFSIAVWYWSRVRRRYGSKQMLYFPYSSHESFS